MLHSTRGGAASVELEFAATLNWFRSATSYVSAHAVIAWDGTIALCVPPSLIAWHAGEHNLGWLGVELVQPHAGDPISDAQYTSLSWWCREMSKRFGFPLNETTLVEHRFMPQGMRVGKTDIGPPFDLGVLLERIR